MLITILYCAPIVLSVIALIFCLIRGFNKVAFFTSAAVSMVIEMLVVKYISNSWYMFVFSLFVPMAVLYTGFSLYISLKEGKTNGKNDSKNNSGTNSRKKIKGGR